MPRDTVAKATLKKNLDRLHAELKSTSSLDPETREMLETVARDIEHALGSEHDADSLRERLERLEGAALRFEAEHPRLSGVLSEITDALAKIGV